MISFMFTLSLFISIIITITNASLQFDLQTGEDIATYNGEIFATTCPIG